jgi:CRP/FNR family transcriptional regulator, transcriptional activator FtrB
VRQSNLQNIRALPLFCDMNEANFEELVSGAHFQSFPAHKILFAEGSLPEFFHIVVEGSVELFASHDGCETTIDIMQPSMAFILAEIMHEAVYLKSARTLAPAQILMIPAKTVRDIFERDAGFARAIAKDLAERYRGVVRALKNEKLRGSAERLANWILRADAEQGGKRRIELPFDKRTLASSLGMTPENLSRNLALLAKYGVKSAGRDIVIGDPAALEKFAKPNALIDG